MSFKTIGTFPSPYTPKSEKITDAFGNAVAKAIEANWFNANNNTFDIKRRKIREWKHYAENSPDKDKFKQYFNVTGEQSYANLDWKVSPIIPKFVNAVVNAIMDNAFDIEVKAVDPLALSERENKKNELLGKIINKPFFEELKNEFNIDLLGPNPENLPQTPEEIEVYLNINFRQAVEIAASIVLRHVFYFNDYPDEIKRQIIADIVITGFGISKVDTDPDYGVTIRHSDPEFFIYSLSRQKNFSDVFYMGELTFIPISEIKRISGNKWPEKTYEDIARRFANQYGNPQNVNVDMINVGGYSYYAYDDYQVPVLDFEYKTRDSVKFEKKQNRYKDYTFSKKPESYTPPKNSKYQREQFDYEYENIYCGLHIVNTEYMLRWGQKENIVRDPDNPRKAEFSYKVYSPEYYEGKFSSLVDKMTTHADQIHLTHLKMQQLIATAAPDGYAINLASLESLTETGKGLTERVVEDIYMATGRLYYRQDNEDFTRNSPPIIPMPSNIQNLLTYAQTIDFHLRMLREITGVNPEMTGQTQRDQLVGVTKIAIAAANNSIGHINHSIRVITKHTAKDCLLRVQDIPKTHPLYKQYVEAVGRESMSVIDAMDNLAAHQFGIYILSGKTDEDRLALERDISAAVANGELRIEDRMTLMNIADTKMAIEFFKVRRKRYQQEKQQEQIMLSQANAQASAQAAQAAEMAKVQSAQAIAKIEIQKAGALHQMDIEKLYIEYPLKAQLEQVKAGGQFQVAQAKAQASQGLDMEKEDRKDERTKLQAEQQSELIEQRQQNTGAKKFTEEKFEFLT